MKYVLDSSALLAILWREPGSEAAGSLLPGSLMSAVNMAEVRSKLSDRGISTDAVEPLLGALPVRIIAFDDNHASAVGALRAATKSSGLSIADRACLALARAQGATAVTADKIWAKVDVGVEVKLIR